MQGLGFEGALATVSPLLLPGPLYHHLRHLVPKALYPPNLFTCLSLALSQPNLGFLGLIGIGCRADWRKTSQVGGWWYKDSPLQLTGSNPVPHDHQKGVQLHSGSSTLPVWVQAPGQCLEAHILRALSCHSLQIGQEVGHSHGAWDKAWWGILDWATACVSSVGW